MPDRSDISPLSITDGKISKGAKIDPTKLAPATSGQVLIAGTDGKFRPGNLVTTASGDTVAQGPAGATGATGSQGATGATGATGADGSDASVTKATVDDALFDSDTTTFGFIKRTADDTFGLDTATYSTTGHTHDDRYYTETEADTLLATKAASSHTHAHADLTSIDANQHLDWTTDRGSTNIHAGNLNLQGVAEEVVDSGADYMVFLDGGATGAAKKESLADLVTKISGDGTSAADDEIRLTASSGILSLYASDLRSQSKIKYVKDITWETNSTGVSFSTTTTTTGDVSSAVCTITHNLNTKYIFVSVIEFSTTDTAHDPSYNNFVENLGEQIDMNYDLTVKPTNDNNIELYSTGSGIYAGSVFKVAIMG